MNHTFFVLRFVLGVCLALGCSSSLGFDQQPTSGNEQQLASQALVQILHTMGWDTPAASTPALALGQVIRQAESGERSFPMALKFRDTKTFRVQIGDTTGVTIIRNGPRAASVPLDGSNSAKPEQPDSIRGFGMPPLLRIAQEAKAGFTVEYLGTRACGTSPCYGLEITPSSIKDELLSQQRRFALWVSSETSLPVQIDFETISTTNSSATFTHSLLLSDYRNVSGVLVPFVQEEQIRERSYYRLVLSTFTFNESFPDSDFEVPNVEGAK